MLLFSNFVSYRHRSGVLILSLLLVSIVFGACILNDVEHEDEFNLANIGLFHQLQHTYDSRVDRLFPHGVDSVKPDAVIQGQICDCKFLATVVCLASTPAGREQIHSMIRDDNGDEYTVSFPGADGTIKLKQPNRQELYYSARTSNENGFYRFGNGTWLPVLEKAYGTYRNTHQSIDRLIIRTIKHAILECRFDPSSELPSFGAAYGAADNEACRILTGHEAVVVPTVSWEIGDSGVGQFGERKVRSWFSRNVVKKEIIAKQESLLMQISNSGKVVLGITGGLVDLSKFGLRSHHAYAILAYDRERQIITVRDPLGASVLREFPCGSSEPPTIDGALDGQFEMTLGQFNALFKELVCER